jgi:hypothetical protein
MLKHDPESNYISICDEVCEFNEADSTSTVTKCKVPAISTIYSDEEFAIATETEDLDSGVYFGTASEPAIAFDGNMLNNADDSSNPCSLGMAFKEGHVGMLSQVKWFMPDIDTNEKNLLVDLTTFEGSGDNTDDGSWETLFTIGENLHAGWNYHKWDTPEDYPKYRFYRFSGSTNGGCNINEITFTGVETIDDEAETYTCSAKVVLDEEETALNSVDYMGSLTTNL